MTMRIRDAITRPVVLATAGAIALTAIAAIAVVGTSAPSQDSFSDRTPPPPVDIDRPVTISF